MGNQIALFLWKNYRLNITGLCLAEFLTRPQVIEDTLRQQQNKKGKNYSVSWNNLLDARSGTQNGSQVDSLEIEVEENDNDEKHLVSVVYASLGELPAFVIGWIDILINITAVSACRYFIFSYF